MPKTKKFCLIGNVERGSQKGDIKTTFDRNKKENSIGNIQDIKCSKIKVQGSTS